MIEQEEIERKFLVSQWDEVNTWPVSVISNTRITQTYLLGAEEGRSERVRSRVDLEGNRTFTWNAKRFVSPGHYKEEEQEIDRNDYNQMLWKRKDPLYLEVVKDRWVFEYEGLTWELDHFDFASARGIAILEVELPSIDKKLTMPPFIHIEREVTAYKHWTNRSMAKVGWAPYPRLFAGQVWRQGDQSFQILSTEDGETGIRAYEQRREMFPWVPGGPAPSYSGSAQLTFVGVDELLLEGWEISHG